MAARPNNRHATAPRLASPRRFTHGHAADRNHATPGHSVERNNARSIPGFVHMLPTGMRNRGFEHIHLSEYKGKRLMCGIAGIFWTGASRDHLAALEKGFRTLLRLSGTRGKDASGAAFWNGQTTMVVKRPISSRQLVRETNYAHLIQNARLADDPAALIGHTRMVTNGDRFDNTNNQPVSAHDMHCVHNGIVVNVEELWKSEVRLHRRFEVDSEVIAALARQYLNEGDPLPEAVSKTFAQLKGSASICLWTDDDNLVLATNTGSLFLCCDRAHTFLAFASEQFIIDRFLACNAIRSQASEVRVQQIAAGTGLAIDRTTLTTIAFELGRPEYTAAKEHSVMRSLRPDWAEEWEGLPEIRRCTRCVLPETIPGIAFDEHGVCSYCRNHIPHQTQGKEALQKAVEPFRRTDGGPDCIVGLSGGRDSCYGLHYLREELGLHPVAFTYDWGMVTDLARRNQARLCGKLGVEHIIISADIQRKRANIAKNVQAWLRQPDLGMIPLFMAGDKQFYYYANMLMKRMGSNLLVFSENPRFEKTHFKSAFCGVTEGARRQWNIGLDEKLRIAAYYGKRFLTNPAYLNDSLLDTAWAYLSSYFLRHNYLYLFNYLDWNRDEVVGTLRREYEWELAPDSRSTWRIGDGTAAFYNFIYFTLTGFTEFDAFRSNQIREGVLERNEAMRLLERDNRPRWGSLQWYLETIGLDFRDTIQTIIAMPRLLGADA